ncbi:MAG: endo-1,4-beta-xylanase [Acidobacteria bacterium]|nr:endo-1,4-beta-xylanase [Acidobacteriota bacterium]
MRACGSTRREFVGRLAAASVLGGQVAVPEPVQARCRILDYQGKPVAAKELDRFHICDFLLRPFPIEPQFSPGEVVFEPAARPFRISTPLLVPGFGHMYVYADNRGSGYTPESFAKPEPLFLNFEFAADRLATVRRLAEECRRSGIEISAAALRRTEQAEALLKKATAARPDQRAAARWSIESLRESLWAGEMIVIGRAEQLIARHGARPGFLFGANAFGFPALGKPYAERFAGLFNYATLPFYLRGVEGVEGKPDYGVVEKILSWLDGTSIVRKGHPLIFLYPGTTPQWLRGRTYEQAKAVCLTHIRRSIARFRGSIHIWDVVNELHHKNVLGFTKEHMIDLTAGALRAAREADPTCFRIVNNCCTWCEYMARSPKIGEQSVYDYLQMVKDAGTEFEAIGLQYYYLGRDLLEFERSIETFQGFAKRIHITELGLPSSSVEVPTAWPHGVRFPWHGEHWSETAQADWIEQFYTLVYSKPYIDAIGWWDVVDPAFIPHGGLLHEDLRTKEAYLRLQALLAKWRRMEARA